MKGHIMDSGKLVLWVECHNGRVPTTNSCFDSGWALFSKDETLQSAYRKLQEWFYNSYSRGSHIVMAYPEDRCRRKFKAKDRILGIFG